MLNDILQDVKNAKQPNQTNNPNEIIFTLTKYHKIPGRSLVSIQ